MDPNTINPNDNVGLVNQGSHSSSSSSYDSNDDDMNSSSSSSSSMLSSDASLSSDTVEEFVLPHQGNILNRMIELGLESNAEDSDDDSSFEEVSLYATLLAMQYQQESMPPIRPRIRRVQYTRIDWDAYWVQYSNDPNFETLIRMKRASFTKLVDYLRTYLAVDETMANLRGGQVCPEMCVYMTLRYLAGGSCGDIRTLISISTSTFYHCLKKTMIGICRCPLLDIKFPTTVRECQKLAGEFCNHSDNDSVRNCVGALDGYLLCINTPCIADARNQQSFFSGHYQRNGINIQAICDANKIFLYFAVTGPGNMNDRTAMNEPIGNQGTLSDLVERLPGRFVVIADAAYEATEHVAPLFYGALRLDPRHDNFNYVASQCRIRIEMAFGYMTNKWRILQRPLCQRLRYVTLTAITIARLHNFCLKEKLECAAWGDDQNYEHVPGGQHNAAFHTTTPDMYGGIDEFENPLLNPEEIELSRVTNSSNVRDGMVTYAINRGARRPRRSTVNRTLNPLLPRDEDE